VRQCQEAQSTCHCNLRKDDRKITFRKQLQIFFEFSEKQLNIPKSSKKLQKINKYTHIHDKQIDKIEAKHKSSYIQEKHLNSK
jgi:hypothetical protein